jgi:hypothetical protein
MANLMGWVEKWRKRPGAGKRRPLHADYRNNSPRSMKARIIVAQCQARRGFASTSPVWQHGRSPACVVSGRSQEIMHHDHNYAHVMEGLQ